MAIIKTIKGDLISLFKQGEFTAIAHGANCFATMGGGIAAQIKQHFPEAYEADKSYLAKPLDKLGRYTSANTQWGEVINLYTQFEPGRNFEYTALQCALMDLEVDREFGETFTKGFKEPIGIPLIGAGIGGGNWEIIKNIFKMSRLKFIVVEWEK